MLVGLCESCANHRVVVSGRGSRFWLCELSRSDASFPRYPQLPVLRCRGYTREAPHPAEPGPPDTEVP